MELMLPVERTATTQAGEVRKGTPAPAGHWIKKCIAGPVAGCEKLPPLMGYTARFRAADIRLIRSFGRGKRYFPLRVFIKKPLIQV
ncbi:hypothetical protein LRS06_18455 [Hymenobacter sp. J193]|uniref:hypothetical protein n=1 Tax=Hymenobacter sp. J193 TaxID=2898429 RepID=UPI0021519BB0|nr:hypothetical protein [Hymenobacter sp. J193]MCR5889718.1 hypothetical protein [Hymenobacter sp. J193]